MEAGRLALLRFTCLVLIPVISSLNCFAGHAKRNLRSLAFGALFRLTNPCPPFKTRREYIPVVSEPASMLATVLKGGQGQASLKFGVDFGLY